MPPKFSAPDDQQERNAKSFFFTTITALLFLGLIARLFYLQYVLYEENSRLSENNRMRRVVIKAERGLIFDRNGEILVRNRPSYQISILPYRLQNADSIYNKLMAIVDTAGVPIFDSAHVQFTLERGRWRKFQPLRILEDASIQQISIIEEHADELPGVITVVEARRAYPYGTLGAHVLGYTGEISEQQLELEKYKEYSFGDRLGIKGLELYYESYFKGENGVKFIEVNAYGKEIGIISDMHHQPATSGSHLVTTLNLQLQKIAEEAFPDSVKGAVVALDPRNGEILVMVSSPRIDPNIFSLERRELAKEWANVALDSDRPLNNRAVVGTYPPGSVFKFVTAIAGLESGDITTSTRHHCTGVYRFGKRLQKCWRSHGTMDIIGALRESCDVFFYATGLEIDMEKINEVGYRFGLGDYTRIDLPTEKKGLLMDSVTYNKRFAHKGWRWTRGQILNLSMGQGQLVTPLQMAVMFGAMATNDGVYRPHIMKEIRSGVNNKTIETYVPEKLKNTRVSAEIHELVIHAMEQVIVGHRGTGGRSRVKGVRIGGKSGSSENPHGEKTHAWFAATGPLEAPEISIAIVMENYGGGGAMAAPIAQKILQQYFYGEQP